MIFDFIEKKSPFDIDVVYVRAIIEAGRSRTPFDVFANLVVEGKNIFNDFVNVKHFNHVLEASKPMFSIEQGQNIKMKVAHDIDPATPMSLHMYLVGKDKIGKIKVIHLLYSYAPGT